MYHCITSDVPPQVELVSRNPPVTLSLVRPNASLLKDLQAYTNLSPLEFANNYESFQKWSLGQALTFEEKIELSRACTAAYHDVADAAQQRYE